MELDYTTTLIAQFFPHADIGGVAADVESSLGELMERAAR